MTTNDFLDALKSFYENALSELILPIRPQSSSDDENAGRSPAVYIGAIPNMNSSTKKAPYILHGFDSVTDSLQDNGRIGCRCTVRTVICVYAANPQDGTAWVSGIYDRIRAVLLRNPLIKRRYKLDLSAGMSFRPYWDDTEPYYMGEILYTWIIPTVEEEYRSYV